MPNVWGYSSTVECTQQVQECWVQSSATAKEKMPKDTEDSKECGKIK